jgi:hypothetical protein
MRPAMSDATTSRDTDSFLGTVILFPGAGGRETRAHWYQQRVIGAVELAPSLGAVTIQSTSVEAFREVAELCTQVAARMEQMYGEAAAPEATRGPGR